MDVPILLEAVFGSEDKFGHVRSNGQRDANRRVAPLFGVVELQSFADFSGGIADNRVGAGVETRRPVKDFDAESSFFQTISMPIEDAFDEVLQQSGVALAVAEVGTGADGTQLIQDAFPFFLCAREPVLTFCMRSIHPVKGMIRAAKLAKQGRLAQPSMKL